MVEAVKVLLIDDDELSSKALARRLRIEGQIDVIDCANGQNALKELAKGTDFTAVFLDFVLKPPMSGEAVLAYIHQHYPHLPVIVMTGRDPSGGVDALEKGAYRYLRRPVDALELIRIVHSLADQDLLLHKTTRDLRRMLNVDMVIAWHLDKQLNQLKIGAWDGNSDLSTDHFRNTKLDLEILKRFITKGRPRFWPNIHDKTLLAVYSHPEEAVRQGWTSLISIPLLRRERIIGLLDCYSTNRYHFRSSEEKESLFNILQAYAGQAAEAIYNTERSAQVQGLQSISTLLAGTHNEDKVIDEILHQAVTLVGADYGWLYLNNIDQNRLELKDSYGIPRERLQKSRAYNVGIAGTVALEGTAINVPDIATHEGPTVIEGLDAQSQVAVPLRREEETIGVLTVKSRHAYAFGPDDVDILTALATYAAIAITRAKLSKHLEEVSRLALEADYNQLVTYVAHAVQDLTGADVSLWRIASAEEGRQKILQLVASQGRFPGIDSDSPITIPINSTLSISGQALATGKPMIRRDLNDPAEGLGAYHQQLVAQSGWRSLLSIPLIGREDVRLGLLSLYSNQVAKFVEKDVEILVPFCAQIATALQQSQHTKALTLLAQTKALTGKIEQRTQRDMDRVAQYALDLLDADCAALYSYDRIESHFYDTNLIGVAGLLSPRRVAINQPRPTGLAAKVRAIEELIVEDVQIPQLRIDDALLAKSVYTQSDLLESIAEAKFIAREEVRAFVAISLVAGDESEQPDEGDREVGVLYINYRMPHHFTDEELQLVRIFAHQVANLIRGARLYLEAYNRASELNAINQIARRIVRQKDLPSVLAAIVQEATDLLAGKGGKLYLVTPDKQQLELVATNNLNTPLHQVGVRINVGEGLAGYVFQSKQPFKVDDYATWPGRIEALSSLFTAVIGAPLLAGDVAIGVIAVFADADTHCFDNNTDRRILQQLAQQAALAIHNAQYAETQELLKQSQTLQKVSNAISTGQSLKELLELIVIQAIDLIGADAGIIHLIDQETLTISYVSEFPRDFAHPESRFAQKTGLTWEMFNAPKLLELSDVPHNSRVSPEMRERGIHTMVGVPLQLETKVIGVLYLNSRRHHQLTAHEKNTLSLLAEQAALAIHRAQLFEENIERRQLLEEVAKRAEAIDEVIDRLSVNNLVESRLRDHYFEELKAVFLQICRVLDVTVGFLLHSSSEAAIDLLATFPHDNQELERLALALQFMLRNHREARAEIQLFSIEEFRSTYHLSAIFDTTSSMQGEVALIRLGFDRNRTLTQQTTNQFLVLIQQWENRTHEIHLHCQEQRTLFEKLVLQLTSKYNVMQRYAERLENEETRRQYLQDVAHQLGGPLTGLRYYAEKAGNAEMLELAGAIQRYARNFGFAAMGDEDMFESNRFTLIDYDAQSLLKLLQSNTLGLRLKAQEKNIDFFIDKEALRNFPMLQINPELMDILIWNLYDNAVKYAYEDTTITVTGAVTENNVKVIISDIGLPFAEHEAEALFRRSYRAPLAQEYTPTGTGIGLFVCQKIVYRHHGTIRAGVKLLVPPSDESKGRAEVQFIVTLPRKKNVTGERENRESHEKDYPLY